MEHFETVDDYLAASTAWAAEVAEVREVLLGCGLDESVKWGKPTYGRDGVNLVILQEMKDFLSVMFFKGALLDDPAGVLVPQGPNSRSAMRVEIDGVAAIDGDALRALVTEAVRVESEGLEVGPAPELELAPELAERLAADVELAEAFAELTPGRQREYNLHIGGAKKSETRAARVTKLEDRIRAGRGMRDR